ncbi:MAG TPA: hypothetical protein VGE74_26400 [Gemmata sp.]
MARPREPRPAPRAGMMVFVVQGHGHDVADCAFTDRTAAEARRRELDRTARSYSNPFDSGTPEKLSSDSAERFWQALTALNFHLPERDQEWRDWWEVLCAGTTAEQRDALWDTLDDLHYFDVIEVPLED